MERTNLTHSEKLEALALKYYNNYKWEPKKGDYYTTCRNDLELYQVVDVDDFFVHTMYCDPSRGTGTSQWEKEKFLLEFGIHRVYVPNWILKIE